MKQQHSISPILSDAKRVLQIEANAIKNLIKQLDHHFEAIIETISTCSGRVIVTGLGKSGVIGQKIAATFASTGTPATFVHAADAIHGDLGMIMSNDVVLAISNSGYTEEVIKLLPQLKRLGTEVIAMTANLKSPLAANADHILNIAVKEEACPHNMAPTASTTAVLAMGDALAVALMNKKSFKPEDFTSLHPGGELGKRLIKVKDIMHTGNRLPKVSKNAPLKSGIYEMTRKHFGCVGVVDNKDHLVGIFTDGDLRRTLEKEKAMLSLPISQVMTKHPIILKEDELAIKAVRVMQDNRIFVLLVTDRLKRLIGIVHFLDLFDAGIV